MARASAVRRSFFRTSRKRCRKPAERLQTRPWRQKGRCAAIAGRRKADALPLAIQRVEPAWGGFLLGRSSGYRFSSCNWSANTLDARRKRIYRKTGEPGGKGLDYAALWGGVWILACGV